MTHTSNLSLFDVLLLRLYQELGSYRANTALEQLLDLPSGGIQRSTELLLSQGLLLVSSEHLHRYAISSAGIKLLDSCGRRDWPEVGGAIGSALAELEQGNILGGCAMLLAMEDELLRRSAANGAVACFEIVLRRLGAWQVQGSSVEEQRQFVAQAYALADTSFYIYKFQAEVRDLSLKALDVAIALDSRRDIALLRLMVSCLEYFASDCTPERLTYLRVEGEGILATLDDPAVKSQANYFVDIFHFWRGHFQKMLDAFEQAQRNNEFWKGHFHTEIFPLYTSSAALYLGKFHQAAGILESAKRSAELQHDTLRTLWWESQLAVVLLYIGDLERARRIIEHVLNTLDSECETKILHWIKWGQAYYYYLKGDVQTSYKAMHEGMLIARKNGFKRFFYSYPWMLDLLYAYQREGLGELYGLSINDELFRRMHGYNLHLKAAALRVRAQVLLDNGASVEEALPLLNESLALFQTVGNPTELEKTRRRIRMLQGMRSTERINIAETDFIASSSPLLPESSPEACCYRALKSIHSLTDFRQVINQVAYIASCELGAEKTALLTIHQNRRIEIQATCNMLLGSKYPASLQEEIHELCRKLGDEPLFLNRNEDGVRLILPLKVGVERWVLYMSSTYVVKTLAFIAEGAIREIAQIFSDALEEAMRAHHRQVGINENQQGSGKSHHEAESEDILLHSSPAMRRLLSQARQLAATNAPVLILGETGVGKELLARYIHECSGRQGKFVAVHPASIAESLFESEFFGYEKGAFTGAVKQKIGLAELAHQGTLFIDEVGDIPGPMQVKLLRVFQNQRFLRAGGIEEVHSEFRLVGATNKDLWRAVQEERFREDLYYRMSVVALHHPPLRERMEDIQVLAQFFLDRFARRYHRSVPPLSAADVHFLMAYNWPGNVRELKNTVERAVILYDGQGFNFNLGQQDVHSPVDFETGQPGNTESWAAFIKELPTLEAVEERYIRHVLSLTGGRVTGEEGALKILGMKRSTLYSRLKSMKVILERKGEGGE